MCKGALVGTHTMAAEIIILQAVGHVAITMNFINPTSKHNLRNISAQVACIHYNFGIDKSSIVIIHQLQEDYQILSLSG